MSAATPLWARTRVELLTVGPGDDPYARFGHTALLVSQNGAAVAVYNYGLSDFDRPGLFLDFLRGEPIFWVGVQRLSSMVAAYRAEDRAVMRQPLNLSPRQTRALVALLHKDSLPGNRRYVYHHFHENCATRPRDRLDKVTGGALSSQLKGVAAGTTWRELMRQGFAGRAGILVLTELFVGRRVDRPVDRWQASFLPKNLSLYLQQVRLPDGRPLAGPTVVIQPRRGPDPLDADPFTGAASLWMLAALVCLLTPATILLRRRRSRWAGLTLLLQALPVGLLAVLCWGLCLISTLPELRQTELVLALWPTDLLLTVVAVRWLRGRFTSGRLLRVYAHVRLLAVSAVLICHAAGVLYQQPRAVVVLVAALAVGLWWAAASGQGQGQGKALYSVLQTD